MDGKDTRVLTGFLPPVSRLRVRTGLETGGRPRTQRRSQSTFLKNHKPSQLRRVSLTYETALGRVASAGGSPPSASARPTLPSASARAEPRFTERALWSRALTEDKQGVTTSLLTIEEVTTRRHVGRGQREGLQLSRDAQGRAPRCTCEDEQRPPAPWRGRDSCKGQ